MNQFHAHPISQTMAFGQRLAIGDKIEPTDVYDSTTGKWEPCQQLAGMTLQSNSTIIIRPTTIRVMEGNTLTEQHGFVNSAPNPID